MSGQFKAFVTDEEVQEQRLKRQSEWEKVRKPDDPIECPEEETRSLFDQLKANKDAHEREQEEENRLRSSVKGLDDEEVQFLNFVSQRQMQIEKERNTEEKNLLQELKEKSVVKIEDKKEKVETSPSSSTTAPQSSSGKKSQQQLLLGAIKRKSTDTKIPSDEKKTKTDEKDGSDAKLMEGLPNINGRMMVAGILPGIADYEDDDSSTENTDNSSDSEADHMIMPSAQAQRAIQEIVQKLKENS